MNYQRQFAHLINIVLLFNNLIQSTNLLLLSCLTNSSLKKTVDKINKVIETMKFEIDS